MGAPSMGSVSSSPSPRASTFAAQASSAAVPLALESNDSVIVMVACLPSERSLLRSSGDGDI